MAKERRKSAINIVDEYLEYLYNNGILHSFIVNTTIMLFLALIAGHTIKLNKPIIISASIADNEQEPVDDEKIFLEIESVVPESGETEHNTEIMVAVPNYDTEDHIEVSAPEIFSDQIQDDIVVTEQNIMEEFSIKSESISKSNSNSLSAGPDSQSSGRGKETIRRLTEAGAQTGEIQVSIAWDNYNDIDLWVVIENPSGRFVINWMNRIGPNNGTLDVDRNVQPTTNRAVENIFWPFGFAPEGKYTVYVQNYWQWDKPDTTPVFLRIKHGDKITEKMITVSRNEGTKKVFSFYKKNDNTKLKNYDSSGGTGPHLPIGQLWSGQ